MKEKKSNLGITVIERSDCCGADFCRSPDNSITYICRECHEPCKTTMGISDKSARNLLKYVEIEVKKKNDLTNQNK